MYLTFALGIQGSSVRVFYGSLQFIQPMQNFIESPDYRMVASDTLIRLFIPAYVSFSVEVRGHTITDEEMRRSMVSYIDNLGNGATLSTSGIAAVAVRLSATNVTTPLTVTIEVHSFDGRVTTHTITDELTIRENERFMPQGVNIIQGI